MDISGDSCKSNPKKHPALADCEEAEPVERKRRCLSPPLPKHDTTEEAPNDKYLVPVEPERSRTPMQGIPATAAAHQGLCSKINREESEAKETTPKVTNTKNSISRPPNKPPGWPESLPPPPASRAWNGRRSSPPTQPPIANGNGEEPSVFRESETPSAIEYYLGIETYTQTDTPYTRGLRSNFRRGLNIRPPGNRRGSNSLGGQRRQGSGGHSGYRGGRKGRKNSGHIHQHNC